MGISYMLWYFITANQTAPVSPDPDLEAYIAEQMIHVVLFIVNCGLFVVGLVLMSDGQRWVNVVKKEEDVVVNENGV